jgi:hypothetical protein
MAKTISQARALLLGCLLALPLPGHTGGVQRYTVTLAPDLTRLGVSTCFQAPVPPRLTAGNHRAGQFLEDARVRGDGHTHRLRAAGGDLPLNGVAPGDCVDYGVRLTGMDARSPGRKGRPPGPDRLTDPGLWLWLPDSGTASSIEVGFELPEGIEVSAPWTRLDADDRHPRYRLADRPRDWDARVARGRLDRFDIKVGGASLRVALLQGEPAADRDAVRRWITAGAQAITTLYGRFPVPSPQVLVVPGGAAREPVPWGQVMRGGGDAVHLYIDQTRPLREFLDDWTLVHELSHLLHPRMASDDAWLYEGIASYYQNVLRARAGVLEPTTAWDNLHAGFQRGILGTPEGQTLIEVSQAMHRNRRFMRVYWSGAAIALMADKELRRRSGDRESLDTALARFQACCLPSDRLWSGRAFLDKLDELTGTRVLRSLYAQHVDSTAFPDLRATYRQLGLEARGARHVRLREDAPLSSLRRAIMVRDDNV